MGLFDFISGNKAGANGEAQPGLISKLGYGGVPFGIRLMAAAEALRTIENPDISRPSLALLARAKEKSDEQAKLDEERRLKQEKADRLADKLQLSNPAVAEIIRANPDLIDEYGKGTIQDTFETKRYTRNRADQVEDRNFNANIQREGWNRADARAEDAQQHDFDVQNSEARLEAEKLKARQAYEEALRKGRREEANLIADSFFQQTGIDVRSETPAVPSGPQPIPTPMPGSVNPTPEVIPGLTQPPAANETPQEQGDAGPASSSELAAFSKYFDDPDLTQTEASILKSAFIQTLSASMQDGKDPDKNLALGAAAEAYQKILKARVDKQTADAATSEAETKKSDADIKARNTRATTSETTINAANSRTQTADDVLNAIKQAKDAMDPKNADWLPATGTGSWMSSFVGDSDYTGNARAIFNAVNTIKANIGFDALQKMREASPTGGALGQVAVQELEMLHSTIASLDQTSTNFPDNLARVEELYSKIKERNENYAEDIKNLRKYPTEENKKEFDDMYGVDAHLKFTGE